MQYAAHPEREDMIIRCPKDKGMISELLCSVCEHRRASHPDDWPRPIVRCHHPLEAGEWYTEKERS